MLKKMYEKAVEIKYDVIDAVDYFLHRRQYDAFWAEASRISEESRVEFEAIHGRPEDSLERGFEELDDRLY